jgi:hypothetical protein
MHMAIVADIEIPDLSSTEMVSGESRGDLEIRLAWLRLAVSGSTTSCSPVS